MSGRITWASYRQQIGDRSEIFRAIARGWTVEAVLYPGSFVDLSPSAAFARVTYVDTDRQAVRYFADTECVAAELADLNAAATVQFLPADYRRGLPLEPESIDLIISLYATAVWDHSAHFLRPGGLLLANPSHGDASLAALDPTLRLVAVARSRGGRYWLETDDLDGYLIPENPSAADPEAIRASGRGIAYTRSAFAYLFQVDGWPAAT